MDRIEEKLTKNTEDISKLAVNMAELTQIVKHTEQRHNESMTAVRETMESIQKLIEKDIESLKTGYADIKGDIRTLKHDLNTAFNVLNAFPAVTKQATETATKVEALEKWQGAFNASINTSKVWINVLWILFGSGLASVVWAVVMHYASGGFNVDIN